MNDFPEESLDPEFIEDGHLIRFVWERDTVLITDVHCPNSGSMSLCNRRRSYCVVDRFLGVYGLECNVGVAPIDGPIEVAWMGLPGESDIDSEFEQVWVVPVTDTQYLEMKNPDGDIE